MNGSNTAQSGRGQPNRHQGRAPTFHPQTHTQTQTDTQTNFGLLLNLLAALKPKQIVAYFAGLAILITVIAGSIAVVTSPTKGRLQICLAIFSAKSCNQNDEVAPTPSPTPTPSPSPPVPTLTPKTPAPSTSTKIPEY